LYLDDTAFWLYKMELEEGSMPTRENEIVLTRGLLDEFGWKADIGDTVTVPYQVRRGGGLDEKKEKQFVVTGFLPDTETGLERHSYSALISKEFLENELGESGITYRFLFQADVGEDATTDEIEAGIKDIAGMFSIPEGDININSDYLAANYIDPSTVPVIACIMLVIVVAGVITIYSIYYVGMADRVQELGRLKAIGATRGQLRQIVLREGMAVAVFSITPAILIGTLIIRPLFSLIMRLVRNENFMVQAMDGLFREGKIPLYFAPVYLLAVAVSLLTVLIALRKPMRLAARISELEAIRYQGGDSSIRRTERKSYRTITVPRLSRVYLFGKKKNTLVTIAAMSMTGIFTVTVAAIVSCADPVEGADSYIIGRYEISLNVEFDNKEHEERSWDHIIADNPLSDGLRESVEAIPGVTGVTCFQEVYISSDVFGEDHMDIRGIPDEFADELLDGVVEGSASYEDLQSGEACILDKNILHWYPDIKVGDRIPCQILDGTDSQKELEVIAIGDYTTGLSNYGYLYMGSAGIRKLCGKNINGAFNIHTKERYNPDTEAAIRELFGDSGLLQLRTWQKEYEDLANGISLTGTAAYAVLAILGIICVMNMVNTMMHSIRVRQREIGMLQAVGMTDRQLTKMLELEGLFYTAGTLVLSVGAGSLLSYPAFLWARSHGMFGIREYHYPFAATVVLSAALLLVQVVLAAALGRSVKKQSVIDKIRSSF